jgi:hypothetical protein
MNMSFRWRFARDFVLGICFILDGLRMILTAGLPFRVSGLSIRYAGWIMHKWIQHQEKIEAAPIHE